MAVRLSFNKIFKASVPHGSPSGLLRHKKKDNPPQKKKKKKKKKKDNEGHISVSFLSIGIEINEPKARLRSVLSYRPVGRQIPILHREIREFNIDFLSTRHFRRSYTLRSRGCRIFSRFNFAPYTGQHVSSTKFR